MLHGILCFLCWYQTQCYKGYRKRKILANNNDECCQHDVMQRYKKLIREVKNNEKLGDDHINAANQLLHSQFKELQGLSSPVIGQKLSFEKFDCMLGYAGYAYYQVLHTGEQFQIMKFTYMTAFTCNQLIIR